MKYDEFIEKVVEGIEERLNENQRVRVNKILKNNNIELDALSIHEKENNVSPTIYLNGYYSELEEGKGINDIIQEIYQLYNEHRDKMEFDVEKFKDFEQIKEKIAYKLINIESNQRLLEDVPYVKMLDLAIVFYIIVESSYLGSATALIHQVHMEMWDKNVEDLYEAAKINTPRILEKDLRKMSDVVRELLVSDINNTIYENDNRYEENCGMPDPEKVADSLLKNIDSDNQIKMYVLTNKHKVNGAVSMLYKDVLKDFSLMIDSEKLIIIPSSIHEVIIMPDSCEMDRIRFNEMVQDVNREELDPGDVLSDHIYIYDRNKGRIEM